MIPKSVTPSRIASNFQEVKIDDEDVKAINEIGEKDPKRFNVPLTCTFSPVVHGGPKKKKR